MSRIITRGMTARLDGSGGLVPQGYGGSRDNLKCEKLELVAKITKEIELVAEWQNQTECV